MRLNNKKIDITSFHEAVHIIQNEDMFVKKNYKGNRYAMLKDHLIASKAVDYKIYRNNYPSFSFEQEAEQEGRKLYYEYLRDINDEGMTKQEIEEKIKKYSKEAHVSKTININGEEIEKSQLFDNLLKENPSIIQRYPILQVEYNLNGSKKRLAKILEALESKYNEDNGQEISDIASCILENVESVSDIEGNELENYEPKDDFISDIKQQFRTHIANLKMTKSTQQLGRESILSLETNYIDQTEKEIKEQINSLDEMQKDERS